MDNTDIINYFDKLAPTWDADMIRSDEKINFILDKGGVTAGKYVLDVACGTGVLFPDYLKRNVEGVFGVDISPQMAKIAAGKFDDERVTVVCCDILEIGFGTDFDCVMIYNAFPHFPEPRKLFAHLAGVLSAPGGRITVAHGMSRAKIDAHHHGHAKSVSVGLMHESELAAMMGEWYKVDVVISDDEKYIVSGYLTRLNKHPCKWQ